MQANDLKRLAAERALTFVSPGMRIGLGTGSTAAFLIDALGAKVKDGFEIIAVATSEATQAHAERLGIPTTSLDNAPHLDLTIDGTDEIDASLRLIKGAGGALLREKIVASASARMIVIADISKKVATLGSCPLPVEVVRFGLTATRNMIEVLAAEAGCRGQITQRRAKDGSVFLTDGGNYILDCAFGRIDEPELLEQALKLVPGVVESGLFVGLADIAIIAGPDGIEVLEVDPDAS
jgi:ribose 5-phosphate isomerase A